MGCGQRPGLDVGAFNGRGGNLIARNRSGKDLICGNRMRGQFVCRDAVRYDLVRSDGALGQHIAVNRIDLCRNQLAHIVDGIDQALAIT